MMSKGKFIKLRKVLKSPVFWMIVIMLVCTIIFLPHIGMLYNTIILDTKVNTSELSISRLELLRIYLSLIGPSLTFIVFRNTLFLQEENRKKNKEDKVANIQRKNMDDANREFFVLLQLFVNQQTIVQNKKVIDNLYYQAISNEQGYGFINDYHTSIIEGNPDSELVEMKRSKGPAFLEATNYTPKFKGTVEEVSLEILNEQYISVQSYIGPYLKLLLQIVKSLNYRVEHERLPLEEYVNFMEVLVSHLSFEEYVVILIASLYVERCLKLGVELVGTNFFGDKLDFEKEQNFEFPKSKIDKSEILIFEATKENIKKRVEMKKQLRTTEYNDFVTFLKKEMVASVG